jgi:uncharacterized protein (TIGR00251 family)
MILEVHLQPRAKTDAIVGWQGNALKIRLTAPPVDDKANDALCRFLAQSLHLPTSTVTLVRGRTSRHKFVQIPLEKTDVRRLLP